MGNREENLKKALKLLTQKTQLIVLSSTYDTAPMYNENQPRFLNMVCRISTTLGPSKLLTFVKSIESKLGRLPNSHNLPCTIDIDILFYGNRVINTPELTIPHLLLHERVFVLVPLVEIAPELVHPIKKLKIGELLKLIDKKGVILSKKLEV